MTGEMPRPKRYDKRKVVRGIARERVGTVPSSKVIVPKTLKKPKHKKDPLDSADMGN